MDHASAEIEGNVGNDPALQYTPGGNAVLELRVAVNGGYGVDWFTCKVWRESAEKAANIVRKGDRVAINGRLATRSWETDDGSKRYATDIVVDKLRKLERGATADSGVIDETQTD